MNTDTMTITRTYHDNCVTGELTYHSFTCKTLELPNLNNQENISCIPEGIYACKKITSQSLGKCIEIEGVDNRTYVRIHAGNFTSQILGCVLVGEKHLDFNNDGITDVTNSKATLKKLLKYTPENFTLEIKH